MMPCTTFMVWQLIYRTLCTKFKHTPISSVLLDTKQFSKSSIVYFCLTHLLLSFSHMTQPSKWEISIYPLSLSATPCSPNLPLFQLHERKFEHCHQELFKVCKQLVPSLLRTTYPLVTGEVRSIVKAISTVLPQVPQLRCWIHIFRDELRWLRGNGAPSPDMSIYLSDVKHLFHLTSGEEFTSELRKMKVK